MCYVLFIGTGSNKINNIVNIIGLQFPKYYALNETFKISHARLYLYGFYN